MLGFLDDVFDIRWRHKLPIPIIASIPLLMVYYAERGNTHVVVPLPLRSIFGSLVNLGKCLLKETGSLLKQLQQARYTMFICHYSPRLLPTASTSSLA